MTGMWSRARRWWTAQEHAWEVFLRAQRPWEQRGPLRWQRRPGSLWELHGVAVPDLPGRNRCGGR